VTVRPGASDTRRASARARAAPVWAVMRRAGPVAGGAAAVIAAGAGLALRGDLTVDVGRGRTRRPLGPFGVDISAPKEAVFAVIADPYLGRTPHAMSDKLEVIERGSDMVLAAHHTRVGSRLVTTTLETVRFSPPDLVAFRLVRGPVPEVTETFRLSATASGTRLDYSGEMGADFWVLGRCASRYAAAKWESTVRTSLEGIKVEAERRASTARRGANT
jgi:Polyketide cyclase / dehydrase and lipid transport